MFPRRYAVIVALFGVLTLQPGYALAGGRVVAWGNSSSTNVPPDLTNVVATAANANGVQCLALNADGTAVSWGYNAAAVPFGLSNLVAVAVGNEHMLALRDDGTVIAWGGNRRGQTNVPPDLTNVIAIAAASDLSLALKADGSVVAWGIQTNVPSRVSRIMAISAGSAENLALKDDGTLISWSGVTVTTGSIGAGMSNLLAVSTGSSHNLALFRDGTVKGWGANIEATNVPVELSKVVAISAGRRSSVALKTDGTVVSWGELDKAPAWLTNVAAIAAGSKFCMALIGNNPAFTLRPFNRTRYVGSTVQMDALGIGTPPLFYQWYWNNIPMLGETNTSLVLTNLDYAQAGNYSVSVSNAVGMTVSPEATLTVISGPPVILAAPENLHLFGGESAKFEVTAIGNEPLSYQWHFGDAVMPGATNPVLIVNRLSPRHAGQYSVMVSNALGIAMSSPAELKFEPMAFWTDIGLWPTGKIPPLTNVAKVTAGGQMFAAHSGDGRVVVWGHGSGSYGMSVSNWLATFTNVARTIVNGIGALALLGDGTVATYEDYIYRNTNCVPGLTNIVAVTAGYLNNLALSDQGKVYAWGRNFAGETNVPSTLTNAVGIASGDACNWAVAADGHVVAWGTNSYGQHRVPIDLDNAVAIAAGQYHCLALREDGTVTAWGDNRAGQTNVPPGLSNVIAIAAGWQHSFALRANGILVGWGGSNAQAAVAAQLDNVVSISASSAYSAAMLGDGRPVLLPSAPRKTRFTGRTVVFNAQALGEPPLFYQWQFNGLNLPGATNAELVLTNAAFEHAGSYRVTVSNRFGIAIGESVQLSLEESSPILRYEPVSQTVFGGERALFKVVADGSGPLTYQWQYEGRDLPDATNSVLTLSNLTLRHAGAYRVKVGNDLGSLTTSNAFLSFVPVARWGVDENISSHYYQIAVPTNLVNTVALAAGLGNNVALRADGTVLDWRNFMAKDMAIEVGLSNVAAISTAYRGSFALLDDGTVMWWGWPYSPPVRILNDETNVVAIAAERCPSWIPPNAPVKALALRGDGTVVSTYGAVPTGLTQIVAIASSETYNLALRVDGTVAAWPWNSALDTNITAGLSNIVSIAGGDRHLLALKADGTVFAWWDTSFYPPFLMNSPSFKNIDTTTLTNVVAIAAGREHNLALKVDGTVVTWGDNWPVRTDTPPGLTNVVAIAAGAYNNLALISDAPLQLTVPPTDFTHSNGAFSVSVPTSKNKAYFLEFTESLAAPVWNRATAIPGDGTTRTLTDTNAITTQRFYRVRGF